MFKYLVAGALSMAVAVPASAGTFLVDAQDHSINSGAGTGLATGLFFTLGGQITVASSTNDLWSAGPPYRISDGSGLTGNRFANALDDSGAAPGTQIGENFGLVNILGFDAPYGALVGRYGDGTFQLFGANFSGAAAGNGELTLFYWDTVTTDNFGDITFNVDGAVPEPATWAMLLLGFGLMGGAMRRRAKTTMRLRYA